MAKFEVALPDGTKVGEIAAETEADARRGLEHERVFAEDADTLILTEVEE